MTQLRIEKWYREEAEKITLQAKGDEYTQSEKVRIYHHELLRKKIKQVTIVNLDTENGLIKGHSTCTKYLENREMNLLLHNHPTDHTTMELMLEEI